MRFAGGFGATAGAASPRTGIKRDIDDLFQKVQEHEDALSRVDATLEKNAVSSVAAPVMQPVSCRLTPAPRPCYCHPLTCRPSATTA